MRGVQEAIRTNAERRWKSTPTVDGDWHRETVPTTPHTTNLTTTLSTTNETVIEEVMSVQNVKEKWLLPAVARRLAQAATLTAVLMQPLHDMFHSVENRLDFIEIACSPTSTMTSYFEDAGFTCLRVNHRTGVQLGYPSWDHRAEGDGDGNSHAACLG